MSNLTPMMRQYNDLKAENPDSILFFRLGDFYEMFNSDAKIASKILNINLTKRHNTPMCGIPYHAAKTYISRLLNAGKKIAVCEQVTKPGESKGIVKREVVQIITPGTVLDEDYLDKNSNNYIVSIAKKSNKISLSYIDMSTGEFKVEKFDFKDRNEKLRKELNRIQPVEIIIQETLFETDVVIQKILQNIDIMITRFPDWNFSMEDAKITLNKCFNTTNLKGFGIKDDDEIIFSAGVLLDYIIDNCKTLLPHINQISVYRESNYLILDESTQKNLEIIKNIYDSSTAYSLLSVVNYTKTSIGFRKLKNWLLNPLLDIEKIKNRQNSSDILYKNQTLLNDIRNFLSGVLDIERLASRVAVDRANARDLLAIRNSIKGFIDIQEVLSKNGANSLMFNDREKFERLVYIYQTIDSAIDEEAPIVISDGKLIKSGFNKELDRLRSIKGDSKQILDNYLEEEKNSTKINNLKIKFNKIIGYFFEVSKGNLSLVPEYFIRRQSLVNNERFTTDKLIQLETELNSATGNAIDLDKKLFLDIRDLAKEYCNDFFYLADYLATLDCYNSFATCSSTRAYVTPEVNESNIIDIKNGRHPVVESTMSGGEFVPNDIKLSNKNISFALITGPNMAGKSTLLRQTALIVLLAQIGCSVPASSAKIGLVDRIFCRVGANDNLARGESTFLVEMNETANILRNATKNSLVIMDEVGRGTSTSDGLSIAQAVMEFLLQKNIKTLFATHYHELTLLEHKSLKNFSLKIEEQNGEIIFVKKLREGSAGSSYGIHAAKIGGLPESVIMRSQEILEQITKNEKKLDYVPIKKDVTPELFSPNEIVLNELRSIDIYSKTPIEILSIVKKWQEDLT